MHPASLAAQHLSRMLEDGRLAQEDYATLTQLLDQDRELNALSKVLNTTELAENIFSFLSPFDLTKHIPLVCKAFKNIVESSHTLRSATFRAPGKEILVPSHIRNFEYTFFKDKSHPVDTVSMKMPDGYNFLERYRGLHGLFFAQPALKQLWIFVTYENSGQGPEVLKACNEGGVTFGCLFQALKAWHSEGGPVRERIPTVVCVGTWRLDGLGLASM